STAETRGMTNKTSKQPRKTKEPQAELDWLPDDDVLGKAYDPQIMRRLLAYMAPHKWSIALALIMMAVQSAAALAGPYIIRWTIDGVLSQTLSSGKAVQELPDFLANLAGQPTRPLVVLVGLFVLASFVAWQVARVRLYIMARVGTEIIYEVRNQLFRHLQRLDLSFYDRYAVGRLISRLISDVGVLQDFVTWAVVGTFRDIFLLVGIIFAMLSMNARLSLLVFLTLPLMVLVTRWWRDRARDSYRQIRRRLASVNANLNENITGVRVVKAFSRERRNLEHFVELNTDHLESNLEAAWLSSVFFPSVDMIGSAAVALVVAYGGLQILGATTLLTAGTLYAFVLYIDRFFDPIRDLARRYNTLQSTMAASERIFELLDREPLIQDRPDAHELPAIDGEVVYEHVWFGYDGEPVLKEINLRVEPGETVALVGETGAGKSSLVAILARFYEIERGRITIDRHDIRRVTLQSLRRQMGVVLQETFLFNGAIADNIRYGRLGASDRDVIAAAKAVGAHAFITQTPEGYNTVVGEGGVHLSVGQRQLIAFARALLADPRILILDEATSSVDTQTELVIQRALERLLEGRTAFVIAHRLSTITTADRIVVIDDGRIVEEGTHEELLARGSVYFKLYTLQWRDRSTQRVTV
ncbi:MAG: ABC transporter ATP-binding protein, partial [Anaerolineae bacterium]